MKIRFRLNNSYSYIWKKKNFDMTVKQVVVQSFFPIGILSLSKNLFHQNRKMYWSWKYRTLIKTISLTCSPLLICRGVEDLRKPNYGSYASDSVNHRMKMANLESRMILLGFRTIATLWKCYCRLLAIRFAENVITVFIILLYVYDIRPLMCTRMRPVMGFSQTSNDMIYQ